MKIYVVFYDNVTITAAVDANIIIIFKSEIGERAASLGQKCVRSTQCQAADPQSTCSSAGLCDCVKKTHKCSAASTGCHPDTFQVRRPCSHSLHSLILFYHAENP